jgi:uroporphyrinogen-III synthase
MKKILYLGLDPSHFKAEGELVHYPVIAIEPLSPFSSEIKSAFAHIAAATHFVFTSRNAVQIFFSHFEALKKKKEDLEGKVFIAIGASTAHSLKEKGVTVHWIAKQSTQEGVIELLKEQDLRNAFLFFPRSSLARSILLDFCKENQIRYIACDLYDTVFQCLKPIPDLKDFDEIVFTSPSTVESFLRIYKKIPIDKALSSIGSITKAALDKNLTRGK